MALQNLCTPAFIYFLYAFTQIIIDVSSGLFNTALLKFTISIVLTIALNHLCIKGFKILSWIIVFVPFIFLTVITSILLLGLGLDPYKGRLTVFDPNDVSHTTNDVREIYTLKYGQKKTDLSSSTFNEGVTGVVDKDDKTETTHETTHETTVDTKSQNTQSNENKSDTTCSYGEYPQCMNEKLTTEYTMKYTDNKQENNTRILSNVLLNMLKTYVSEIPEEETTEKIVEIVHGK